MCVHVHTCMHACMCARMYAHMCVRVCVCACVRAHACVQEADLFVHSCKSALETPYLTGPRAARTNTHETAEVTLSAHQV